MDITHQTISRSQVKYPILSHHLFIMFRGREENDILYTGYDIVQSNIDSHIETFANETWQFEQHDIGKISNNRFLH